ADTDRRALADLNFAQRRELELLVFERGQRGDPVRVYLLLLLGQRFFIHLLQLLASLAPPFVAVNHFDKGELHAIGFGLDADRVLPGWLGEPFGAERNRLTLAVIGTLAFPSRRLVLGQVRFAAVGFDRLIDHRFQIGLLIGTSRARDAQQQAERQGTPEPSHSSPPESLERARTEHYRQSCIAHSCSGRSAERQKKYA